MNIYYPAYIQIVRRTETGWTQPCIESKIDTNNRALNPYNGEKRYGLTKNQIITELFRKFQGKLGYYIIHLPKKEYHYCGTSDRDIQEKLWEMGITKRNPREKNDLS